MDVRDEELIIQVAEGDEDAFGILYERYKEMIAAHLWRLCGDAELTADAVSETFLRVWRSARSYSADKGAFKTWLLTIAANALRTLWRRQNTPTEPLPPAGLPDPSPPPDARGLASSVLRCVWDCLDLVHRQALSLRFFSELSYSEIAEIQCVPISTVRTRVFYGLRKLRTQLEDKK